MQKIGNPTWRREELILALDLYLSRRGKIPGKTSDEVAELSEFLNFMAEKTASTGSSTFRNKNGVYMKLMNFKALDPEYTKSGKVGLVRVGRGDKQIWAEFGADAERCRLAAKAIREAAV